MCAGKKHNLLWSPGPKERQDIVDHAARTSAHLADVPETAVMLAGGSASILQPITTFLPPAKPESGAFLVVQSLGFSSET